MSSTFLRILVDPQNAHLWIISTAMPISMIPGLLLNLSGIDPNAPITTRTTFALTIHIFLTSLKRFWYSSTLIFHIPSLSPYNPQELLYL